ncbi:competence/damage-inducible protein A [Methylobacillus arboreus]|uniref:competence/damage-inducible protein A n=1 Tax=Methylobacillus arboreus TaxID=755170 RepID=UPI001E4E8470|nr:molybdopterin-binding protein [Methylobacillus arboreus]MCB5191128.1 competence/damage-inducible protein A [Methylobacillus arboreus]
MTNSRPPRFGAVIIGDEILSGKRKDGHLAKVISLLAARGLALSWAEYLGDDRPQIVATLKRTMTSPDVVFCFGGIGATPDDQTRQAAAEAAGLPIARHPGAVAEIESRFGEAAYPKRVLMADFPLDAALIPNPVNRVPGFSLGQHYFMPGFPEMAWPMTEWILDTHYAHLFHQHAFSTASILVFDTGESQLLDLMEEITRRYPAIRLFSLPRLDARRTIELGLKGNAGDVAEAMQRIQTAIDAAGSPWQACETK